VGENNDLDARYGRTRSNRRRAAWVTGGVTLVFAIVIAVWVVRAGFDGTASRLSATDTSHTIIDAHSVRVSFQVSADPGTAVGCALQALNESFAIVGWKVVTIPPSRERTRAFTELVRTTEQSNTGLIYQCWLN